MQKVLESDDERKQNAARLLHILITYLYYSDPAVDSQVGYTRFRVRSRPEARTTPGKSKLRVLNAVPLQKSYDVCIVGSGIAGSILANRLAKQGKSVLVLEAGRYYPEGAITDDEFLMLAHLYKADIFQAAVGDTFPVIQAKCVGGGSVVNNAVCFRLPDWVRQEWANLGAGLDSARFQAAFDKLETELKIRPADQVFGQEGQTYLNPAREFFLQGVQKLGLNHGTGSTREVYEGFYTVAVNVENCLGCGYCNLGCAYERKVNTLKALLPDAIRTGNCDVVQMAHVDSGSFDWLAKDRLKATSLRVKLWNGDRINVEARKFILSAGAIGSSEILLRSPELKLSGLPVGKYFSANAGSPVHARFSTLVNAYDGLQISDYYVEKNGRGEWDWIAEIWYNPPATQSQGIPGYLDTHFERMKLYPYYAAIGPLVGTEAVGEIKLTYSNQTQVKLRLPDSDIGKLKKAIHRCSEIYFEAGAEEILLITNPELVLKSKDDLAKIQRQIQSHDDFLVLSSGHPMGGNRMSDARSNGKPAGVVGTNFKVHGVEDLFVCDASVFPTSAKVNPQWTVMALAELCAQEIAREL